MSAQYQGFLNGEIEYEKVAASATDQAIGASGTIGDYLDQLIITPTSGTPGTVTVKDGATTVMTITLAASADPRVVPIGLVSVASGGWKITTGADVAVVACGNFT